MSDFNLTAPYGANKKKRIVGRGSSSGRGTTAGRGNKGQKARSGGKSYIGFEGGQMPLYRRVAKKGFTNFPFKKEYVILNVDALEQKYTDGEVVDKESLILKRLIKNTRESVKLLGNGELTKKLTVNVDKISASAKEKIEKAGGSIVQAQE
ncbi:50S ribosomal protein L15 [Treponema phagedenis]|uniref:Large ribosomal subunit protein uL15 n=1 Tax=Treponema phagedenis TaxID=162 RepID=A0A0B7GXM8_TREPH|nr:50S ribosomal protein L15 [Treponema phagedenis]EFW36685.1 ribosomal protein L15 [Treponema phagedenis F0421]NVP24168.1 50S ribosomal protein L15 [Treponema phagedenis]QEJ96322.1 50S ribosomal protein L15 [Treponema phagedenis]QEJ99270.1 50S ribosomal protein L15 [Treponema phagedenis]QEK00099.1 50S ribosomal protein L15 [Treponema phagedenis]